MAPPPTSRDDKPHKRALDDDSPTSSTGRLADRFQTLARISTEVLGGEDGDDDPAHKRRKVDDEQGDDGSRKSRSRGSEWARRQSSNVRNCDGCRARKTKCDRSRPCGNCRLRSKPCTYSDAQVDPLNSTRLDKNVADSMRLKQHAFMLARRLGLSQHELEDLSRVADRLFEDEAKRTLPKGMWLPSKRLLVEVLRTRDAARCVTLPASAPPSISPPPMPSAHGPPRAPPPSSRPPPPQQQPPPPHSSARYCEYDVAASWSSLQQAQQDETAPQPVNLAKSSSPPPPHSPKSNEDTPFTSVPLERAVRLFGSRSSAIASAPTASGLVTSSPARTSSTSIGRPPLPPPRPSSPLPPPKWSPPSLGATMTPAQRASTATLPPLAIPALAYRSMHLSSAVTSLSSAFSPLRTASTASTTPASAAPPPGSSCVDDNADPLLPQPVRLSAAGSPSSSPPNAASTSTSARPRLASFACVSAIAELDLASARGEGPSGEGERPTTLPPLRLPPMLHAER